MVPAPSRNFLLTISYVRHRFATPPCCVQHRQATPVSWTPRLRSETQYFSRTHLDRGNLLVQFTISVRSSGPRHSKGPWPATMLEDDASSITTTLAAQPPIVQEIVRSEVEHGVLIPLKTTLELRDDYVTGRVLITRAPVKAANPAIRYAIHYPPSGVRHCFRCLIWIQLAAQSST